MLTEPVPPGAVPVKARITNRTENAYPLVVSLPTGRAIPGAVHPVSIVPASSTIDVTFHVPATGDWVISAPIAMSKEAFSQLDPDGCVVHFEIVEDGSATVDCLP